MMASTRNKAIKVSDESTLLVVGYNTVLAIAAWILSYTQLPIEPAIILGLLMICDYFLGIAIALHLGEEVSSKKMRHGAFGKFLTFIFPILIAVTFKAAGQDMTAPLVAGVIILMFSELYSIGSHIAMFKYGYRMPELDGFKMLLDGLGKWLKHLAKTFGEPK